MRQATDTEVIKVTAKLMISENPDYMTKATLNPKLTGRFIGQAIMTAGGKTNHKTVRDMVAKKAASFEIRSSI